MPVATDQNGIDKDFYQRVATAMTRAPASKDDDNHAIPAGYTYLAQFVAHDLMFTETTSSHFRPSDDKPNDLGGYCVLDLKSLYANGPGGSPRLYVAKKGDGDEARWPWRMALGKLAPSFSNPDNRPDRELLCPFKKSENGVRQVYKNQDDTYPPEWRALLADPRNDENLITSQMTVLFGRLHNRIGDLLKHAKVRGEEIFGRTRAMVLLCYRKIVLFDLLEKLCDMNTFERIEKLAAGSSTEFRFFRGCPAQPFHVPDEFAFSALRAGHAMIRDRYNVSDSVNAKEMLKAPDIGDLMDRTDVIHRPQVVSWQVDWHRFFWPVTESRSESGAGDGGEPFEDGGRNPSKKIGPGITRFLNHDGIFNADDDGHGLVYLDLLRGEKQDVPTAQEFGKLYPKAGFDTHLVSEPMLKRHLPGLNAKDIARLSAATPLYLYVLIEAAETQGGTCFGPVGATIIGETMVAAYLTASERKDDFCQAKQDWARFAGGNMPGTMSGLIELDDTLSIQRTS